MDYRPNRLPAALKTAPILRIATLFYLITGAALLVLVTILYVDHDIFGFADSQSFISYLIALLLPVFLCLNLFGMALVLGLLRKCRQCQAGPGKRISSALDKMSKGDFGWRLILRHGDELEPVADSVSQASQNLAVRMAKLQAETRELIEIENYLLDAIQSDYKPSPLTLKALRRLHICTSRLQAEMDDFQISAQPQLITAQKPKNQDQIPVTAAL